jgi:hypothetical protein
MAAAVGSPCDPTRQQVRVYPDPSKISTPAIDDEVPPMPRATIGWTNRVVLPGVTVDEAYDVLGSVAGARSVVSLAKAYINGDFPDATEYCADETPDVTTLAEPYNLAFDAAPPFTCGYKRRRFAYVERLDYGIHQVDVRAIARTRRLADDRAHRFTSSARRWRASRRRAAPSSRPTPPTRASGPARPAP